MAITIKSKSEIDKMRVSCRLTKEALLVAEKMIAPGVTTREIDDAVADFIKSQNAIASFLGQRGTYPASTCISVNEEVIHGIPGIKKLKDGDIVSIDVGVLYDGFHGDAARTFAVGNISDEAQKLIDVTRESFFKGMEFAKAGCHLHQISGAIGNFVRENGFSVVRDFVGHGIGSSLHESPEIPHYPMPNRGARLTPGMTLAIEPMVNMGTYEVKILSDNWTVVTRDKKYSAHYENTVLITDDEPEIMTL